MEGSPMFKNIIVIIAALVLVVFGAIYFSPSQTELTRSVVIERDAKSVFSMVNNFKHAQTWSPWAKKDSSMEVIYSGPVSSGGARMSWKSNNAQIGSGSQEIIESKAPEFVQIRLSVDGQKDAQVMFKLESQSDTRTKLTWSLMLEHSKNPIEWYKALMLDASVGADYEKALSHLKAILENSEGLEQEVTQVETKEKVQMVDENGKVLNLSEEEMQALNEKSAKQKPKRSADEIQKEVEKTIQQQLEIEEAKKLQEQKAQEREKALEAQSKKNNEVKSKTLTGKENY